MKLQVYGIPNCNSVKKARDWLEANGMEYTFHDFKKENPTSDLLQIWLKKVTLDDLINRKGTTWRQLSDSEKAKTQNLAGAIQLMVSKPSVIKRPVIVRKDQIILGYDLEIYQSILLR